MNSSPNSGPDFSKNGGLLPVIAQDVHTGRVLMLAYMNQEAYQQTRQTGLATYYSRSRNRLWQKGEQSGHRQHVRAMLIDCDADTILLQVEQEGPACHKGYRSCFYRQADEGGWRIIEPPLVDPAHVYRQPGPHPDEESCA